MPKTAISYDNTEITFYRFVCENPNIINTYVGSTSNFEKRKQSHKSAYNNTDTSSRLVYQTIKNNGGWNSWKMIEIETRLVKNKREAERIEQEYIEKFNADMNMIKAIEIRSIPEIGKQYYIENAEIIKTKQKQYYIENTEQCKQYAEEYRKKHREESIEYQKVYRVEQASKISDANKKRHEKNIDAIKTYREETIVCECGCISTKVHLKRHKKTIKHINFMNAKMT